MKRRPRQRYRAIRRVPQAYPGLYLRLKVAPIVPALAATVRRCPRGHLRPAAGRSHPRAFPLRRHGYRHQRKIAANLL